MTYDTPEERDARVHEILFHLIDEEFWTVMGSQVFELFGVYHVTECPECGPREVACRKRWGYEPNTVPILTPFQREIRRMEGQVKIKKKDAGDALALTFAAVDSTFAYFKGERIDS